MQRFLHYLHSIGSLAFAPDLPYLAATGYDGIVVWNTDTGQLVTTLRRDTRFSGAQLTFLAGGYIFIPHYEGWTVYDIHRHIQTGDVDSNSMTVSAAISADGTHVVRCNHQPDTFRLYHRQRQGTKLAWELPLVGRSLFDPLILPNKTIVAVDFTHTPAGLVRSLVTLAMKDGATLHGWPISIDSLSGLHASTDGRYAADFDDHSVVVWNLEQPGTAAQQFVNPTKRRLTQIALSPTGDKIATLTRDALVRLCDRRTGTWPTALMWNIGPLVSVTFSPDGLRAAVGSATGDVVVWDVE